MRAKFSTPPEERLVRIRVVDPNGPARTPTPRIAVQLGGVDYYDGDDLVTDGHTATDLIRSGRAVLEPSAQVQVRIRDPLGKPQRRNFGVSIGGRRVAAGEMARIEAGAAVALVREHRAEWVDGPPVMED